MSGSDRVVVEAPGLAGAQGTALLERMLLIRRFEDAVQRLFQRGEVHGTTHLYSGREAGAVGVCAALSAGDRVADFCLRLRLSCAVCGASGHVLFLPCFPLLWAASQPYRRWRRRLLIIVC